MIKGGLKIVLPPAPTIKKTLTLFEDLGILQIYFGLKRKIDLVATQQQIATQNCTESKIKN